jgi:hypothetical protein
MIVAWIRLILKSLGKVLSIFKINDWLKNKHKSMGLNQISGSTQIVFTVKTFIAFIVTLLGIFYGFYQLVVIPRMNTTDTMIMEQKEQNKITAAELIKINTSIGTLTGTLQVVIQDKVSSQNTVANSGGSFGTSATQRVGSDTSTALNGHH